jgi:hypothetical protein
VVVTLPFTSSIRLTTTTALGTGANFVLDIENSPATLAVVQYTVNSVASSLNVLKVSPGNIRERNSGFRSAVTF